MKVGALTGSGDESLLITKGSTVLWGSGKDAGWCGKRPVNCGDLTNGAERGRALAEGDDDLLGAFDILGEDDLDKNVVCVVAVCSVVVNTIPMPGMAAAPFHVGGKENRIKLCAGNIPICS